MNSQWKVAMAAVILLIFPCVGLAHVIKPGWFIKGSGVRNGGELLTDWNRLVTDWNRLGFQIAGAILAGLAAYMLYGLFRS